MTLRATSTLISTLALTTAFGGGLMLAGAAVAQTTASASAQAAAAQETPAQARARAATSSLNGGPAETTLRPRLNAQPPLSDAERGRTAVPVQAQTRPPVVTTAPVTAPARTQANTPARPPVGTTAPVTAPARTQAQTRPPVVQTPGRPAATPTAPANAQASTQTPAAPRGPSVTLEPGQTQPAAIPLALGYYVRGDKGCDQVWPSEGDLAWLTPTSFTIDFGGCEPGQFLQTGPNAWTEEQKCMTEMGGDAGVYNVSYEVIGTNTLLRRAHLAIDDRIEQDLWAHCETATVPEEARFKS